MPAFGRVNSSTDIKSILTKFYQQCRDIGGLMYAYVHVFFFFCPVLLSKQGVDLTGRNSTGPSWNVTDDDRRRRQTPESISSLAPYTMCKRASNEW